MYTALFGDYEDLNEDAAPDHRDVRAICFTDDPTLVSDFWEIHVVEPRFPFDLIRSARMLKIVGHPVLNEFAETLWIDNSVTLRVSPGDLLDEWLADSDFALPRHSYRLSVLAEFDQVASRGYDDPTRVYEQLLHYSQVAPDVLHERPYWSAILARRRTEDVAIVMNIWAEHVLRYSRRDQLSLNLAVTSAPFTLNCVELDNFASEYHRWPTHGGRRPGAERSLFQNAMRPPLADVGKLENEVATLRAQHQQLERELALRQDALERHEEQIATLVGKNQATVARHRKATRAKNREIEILQHEVVALKRALAAAHKGATG
jgi:hypothetical protein